jgi:hypothetical protein
MFSTPPLREPGLELIKLMDEGKIRVPLESEWKFDDLIEAYDRIESKRTRGKIIIAVWESGWYQNDGWDVKERFYCVGCDPALLKSESEALPPPHETIPIELLKCEFEGWIEILATSHQASFGLWWSIREFGRRYGILEAVPQDERPNGPETTPAAAPQQQASGGGGAQAITSARVAGPGSPNGAIEAQLQSYYSANGALRIARIAQSVTLVTVIHSTASAQSRVATLHLIVHNLLAFWVRQTRESSKEDYRIEDKKIFIHVHRFPSL